MNLKNRKGKMDGDQNEGLVGYGQKAAVERPNYKLMSLQKIIILLLVLIGVVLVVYIMPMPEEYFLDCDRECHELDWPMICRIKLTVEVYKTMSRACGNCSTIGGSTCLAPHCISADGRERGVLVANRMLPAPKIHVCRNDILVIDVVNRAPSHSLAFHWRGQPQKETPFMDGAPMLTQCPAPSFTTFQYKFRASEAGTHMYHSHSGSDAADGLAGALVVRLPPKLEPSKKYYDEDLSEHVLLISEWGRSLGVQNDFEHQTADSILINGMGQGEQNMPHAVFNVTKGVRYRFRIAYSGGVRDCPVSISVEKHRLRLIALDGHAIEPEYVQSVQIGRGERVDVVIETYQAVNAYGIFIQSAESCQEDLSGFGELKYLGLKSDNVIEDNVANEVKISTLDVSGLKGANLVPNELTLPFMEETIFMPFHYFERQRNAKKVEAVLRVEKKRREYGFVYKSLSESQAVSPLARRFEVVSREVSRAVLDVGPFILEGWGTSDGHRFAYPASPLLTQADDTKRDELCPAASGDGGECVHVRTLPLGATVELVLHHQGGESEEIFHLHGYSFYVVGVHRFNTSLTMDNLRELHRDSKLFPKQNLINPVRKDTIMVPTYGVVALRFKADNPGYWLMRDEKSAHWTRGLDFVLKVGQDKDFVRAPADFPKCGSYIGPEYFLI